MEALSVKKQETNKIHPVENNSQDFLMDYKNSGPDREINNSLKQFISGTEAIPRDGFEVNNTSENLELHDKISNFIETSFSKELRNKLSITEIVLDTDTVWVRVPADEAKNESAYDSYVPRNVFAEKLESLSSIDSDVLKSYVRRAVSHVAYNSLHPMLQGKEETFDTPIHVYNQEFDVQNNLIKKGEIEEAGLGYLAEISPEKQQEMYLLGSVAHEIGHHIFENTILNSEGLLDEIVELMNKSESITEYSDSFDVTKNPYLGYHERFAEVIRLYTTTPNYLKDINLELYQKIDEIMNDGV